MTDKTESSPWTLNFPLRSQGLFLYHQARNTATYKPYPDLHIAVTKSLLQKRKQSQEPIEKSAGPKGGNLHDLDGEGTTVLEYQYEHVNKGKHKVSYSCIDTPIECYEKGNRTSASKEEAKKNESSKNNNHNRKRSRIDIDIDHDTMEYLDGEEDREEVSEQKISEIEEVSLQEKNSTNEIEDELNRMKLPSLSTGSIHIDNILGKGLPRGQVTELCGISGVSFLI